MDKHALKILIDNELKTWKEGIRKTIMDSLISKLKETFNLHENKEISNEDCLNKIDSIIMESLEINLYIKSIDSSDDLKGCKDDSWKTFKNVISKGILNAFGEIASLSQESKEEISVKERIIKALKDQALKVMDGKEKVTTGE